MENSATERIYLIGFMGVGKSTIGKQLAGLLGYRFLDIDRVFENKYKININSFFEKYDELLFRKLEYNILEESFTREKTVISTGGGTPCFFDAMERMNRKGLTVYLEMDTEEILSRLKRTKKKRPLVSALSEQELRKAIAQKLEERIPFYSRAKIIYPATDINLNQLVKMITQY
ncbi:MAG: shikimate kinase [bacterium]|jgi:shikimate kinase